MSEQPLLTWAPDAEPLPHTHTSHCARCCARWRTLGIRAFLAQTLEERISLLLRDLYSWREDGSFGSPFRLKLGLLTVGHVLMTQLPLIAWGGGFPLLNMYTAANPNATRLFSAVNLFLSAVCAYTAVVVGPRLIIPSSLSSLPRALALASASRIRKRTKKAYSCTRFLGRSFILPALFLNATFPLLFLVIGLSLSFVVASRGIRASALLDFLCLSVVVVTILRTLLIFYALHQSFVFISRGLRAHAEEVSAALAARRPSSTGGREEGVTLVLSLDDAIVAYDGVKAELDDIAASWSWFILGVVTAPIVISLIAVTDASLGYGPANFFTAKGLAFLLPPIAIAAITTVWISSPVALLNDSWAHAFERVLAWKAFAPEERVVLELYIAKNPAGMRMFGVLLDSETLASTINAWWAVVPSTLFFLVISNAGSALLPGTNPIIVQ